MKDKTHKSLPLSAEWTSDCCGKQDYDGHIISISTRYWPRGGSMLMFDTANAHLGLRPINSGEPPSATSSLILQHDDDEEDYIDLATKDFVGETEQEVKEKVEKWAQKTMDHLVNILRQHYRFRKP